MNPGEPELGGELEPAKKKDLLSYTYLNAK